MIPLSAFVCLALLLPLTVDAQTPTDGNDKAPQTANSTTGIPTFYAHARQVIVEADVWKPVDKKHPDADWIPQGSLDGVPGAVAETLKRMPPPAKGLTAGDFHVFDNGVEHKDQLLQGSRLPLYRHRAVVDAPSHCTGHMGSFSTSRSHGRADSFRDLPARLCSSLAAARRVPQHKDRRPTSLRSNKSD